MIARVNDAPVPSQDIDAIVCWMTTTAAAAPRSWRSSTPRARHRALVKDIQYRLDVNTLHRDQETKSLGLNEVAVLIGELIAAAGQVREAGSEERRVFEILAQLADRYPDDPAVLVALLLNDVVLEPGDAMYIAPGIVHAHGSGLAVEIMAASDNVLRAGLTPKHRDVEELLAVTDFTPGPPPVTPPSESDVAFARFTTPAAEFELLVGKPPLPELPATGPRILLALDAEVEVHAGGETQRVPRGRAVFLEHDDGPVTVTGAAWVALGAVPPAPSDLP